MPFSPLRNDANTQLYSTPAPLCFGAKSFFRIRPARRFFQPYLPARFVADPS